MAKQYSKGGGGSVCLGFQGFLAEEGRREILN